MTQNLPEPSRRSFIVRLTKSILHVASELNKLAEAWQEPTATSIPTSTLIDPSAELQQQQIAQIRAIQKLPSTYHVFLYQCFNQPRTIAEIPFGPRSDQSWQMFVGEEPRHIVERLQEIGALVRSDLSTHLMYKFSYVELAALLKVHGLPKQSNKHDMAAVLANSVPQEMWDSVDDLVILKATRLALDTTLDCLQRVPIDIDDTSAAHSSDQPDDNSAKKVALYEIIRSTLKTAADGIVGNRADAAILALIAYVLSETSSETSEQSVSNSPLPTPVQESALPEPPPEPPVQANRPSRSTLTPLLTFDWVTIPVGTFLMGSHKAKDKDAFNFETLQHQVYLPTYRIARVPVTVAQFAAFVEATGYQTTAEQEGWAYSWLGKGWYGGQGAYWAAPRGPASHVRDKADHPVTCISWHDANAFCVWATELYEATGQQAEIRLPTEAEWEKAARGTDGRIWPWGNEPPDDKRCNFNMNVGDTTPVKHYPAGAYGLYDMAGNVWEWTSSLYKDYPYSADDGRENPATGGYRVVHGGWFGYDRSRVRCAYRYNLVPDDRTCFIGFRLVSPGS